MYSSWSCQSRTDVAPRSAAAISAEPRVGSERGQVGIGPPGVVDLAQVGVAWIHRQAQRRRPAAAVLTVDHPRRRGKEPLDLVGRKEDGRDPIALLGVCRRRYGEIDRTQSSPSMLPHPMRPGDEPSGVYGLKYVSVFSS